MDNDENKKTNEDEEEKATDEELADEASSFLGAGSREGMQSEDAMFGH